MCGDHKALRIQGAGRAATAAQFQSLIGNNNVRTLTMVADETVIVIVVAIVTATRVRFFLFISPAR